MSVFKVKVERHQTWMLTIRADSKDEAEDIASDLATSPIASGCNDVLDDITSKEIEDTGQECDND